MTVSQPSSKSAPIIQTWFKDLVSFCTVTMDRYDITQKIVKQNIIRSGWPALELLSVDNGSKDRRVPDYIASLDPFYHRLNSDNEGYSLALNQMLHRARGEFICICDPDIELPPGWLNGLVSTYRAVKKDGSIKPGISGYWSVLDHYPVKTIAGLTLEPGWNVFGMKFYHRSILKEAGWYQQDFGCYGNEDVDMNHRLNRLGFTNYYLPGMAPHLGDDCYEDTPYRKMKWEALEYAGKILNKHLAYYDETKNYYVPPPPKRFLMHPSHKVTDPVNAITTGEQCELCHTFGWMLETKCLQNKNFRY